MTGLEQLITKVENFSESTEVPKKIKDKLRKISSELKNDKQDDAVKITSAIYELDAVSNDRTVPMHVKTMLWNLIGELEGAV